MKALPASLTNPQTGFALAGLLIASLVAAQVPPAPAKPSVAELLWKWTPLLAQGFLFNLVISFCAMAVGTVLYLALGFVFHPLVVGVPVFGRPAY